VRECVRGVGVCASARVNIFTLSNVSRFFVRCTPRICRTHARASARAHTHARTLASSDIFKPTGKVYAPLAILS
jgi:hypothetical protein